VVEIVDGIVVVVVVVVVAAVACVVARTLSHRMSVRWRATPSAFLSHVNFFF